MHFDNLAAVLLHILTNHTDSIFSPHFLIFQHDYILYFIALYVNHETSYFFSPPLSCFLQQPFQGLRRLLCRCFSKEMSPDTDIPFSVHLEHGEDQVIAGFCLLCDDFLQGTVKESAKFSLTLAHVIICKICLCRAGCDHGNPDCCNDHE